MTTNDAYGAGAAAAGADCAAAGAKTGAVFLSVVVPCFNEEAAIRLFYARCAEILPEMKIPCARGGGGVSFELVFVDDGSKDGTLEVLRGLARADERVHYLSFSRNFGKEAAMLAGLRAAAGDYTAVMDVDGQDPVDLVPEMLAVVAAKDADCAATRRVDRAGEPPVRSFFARRFYALMAKITDIDIVDGARDFRLMSRKYRDAVLSLPERGRFSKGIFPWVGFKTRWFEYENIERAAGDTKWSFKKLFLYSLDGIIAFSAKPLAFAAVCGFAMCAAALVFMGVIIVRKFMYRLPDSGWSSIMCAVIFTGGVQLVATGILGQYLVKIYAEVKQRPHYVIQEAR